MKIRIKDKLPKELLPREFTEKLVGCEISLSTMANPEGEDWSGWWKTVCEMFHMSHDEIFHEVDVEMILAAIEEKHGKKVGKEIFDLVIQTYGALFIMSTISLPAKYCEVIPD